MNSNSIGQTSEKSKIGAVFRQGECLTTLVHLGVTYLVTEMPCVLCTSVNEANWHERIHFMVRG